ncbi:hypothetical protein SAMN05192583_1713 [Sphingomonas gellani]|uniref:Uncharacterized protein n=1 Tax=Sphingomonas gellani TaxID=1166340 RepID=A0A1H8CS24_9SPHN|nr:hypothetical protein [Sphingomonas gellani]SEM97254.1 hypothetical protein SAMN05192583_1713 [Sphingomonas gellani]
MKKESEADYFARRERAARDLAAKAADPAVARVHQELADNYAAAASNAADCAAGVGRGAADDRPST